MIGKWNPMRCSQSALCNQSSDSWGSDCRAWLICIDEDEAAAEAYRPAPDTITKLWISTGNPEDSVLCSRKFIHLLGSLMQNDPNFLSTQLCMQRCIPIKTRFTVFHMSDTMSSTLYLSQCMLSVLTCIRFVPEISLFMGWHDIGILQLWLSSFLGNYKSHHSMTLYSFYGMLAL